MAEKLVIMLLNLNPDIPGTLGTPFFHATAAAAMELEVSVYFASRTAKLLRRGFAESLFPGKSHEKSVYSFMRDAHEAGARFYACGVALTEHEIGQDETIPEVDGIRGAAAFIGEIAEDGVIVLTY
ncbi:MAG: DsrE family protein [Chromatiales bacterium]|nr:DsrE family protein [Chromatiales bacterium]MDX9766466.1 DsrE family protein [Ectothiorhodospiraceae bacterium]